MTSLPLPVRLAAGLVATAVEQARDLPRTLAELPITAVSQTLQASMRVQQRVTELAIKGDRALAALQPVEEQPSWATFDDDEEEDGDDEPAGRRYDFRYDAPGTVLTPGLDTPSTGNGAGPTPLDLARGTAAGGAAAPVVSRTPDVDGADALDEIADAEAVELAADAEDDEGGAAPSAPSTDRPSVLPEYTELSIPQLRDRLHFLATGELESLLEWELAHEARPAYVTLLENRITTVAGG